MQWLYYTNISPCDESKQNLVVFEITFVLFKISFDVCTVMNFIDLSLFML